MVWKDGDTVTAVTVALIAFAKATPWRIASSDRAEPSVGIKMCLYIAASSPGRAPSNSKPDRIPRWQALQNAQTTPARRLGAGVSERYQDERPDEEHTNGASSTRSARVRRERDERIHPSRLLSSAIRSRKGQRYSPPQGSAMPPAVLHPNDDRAEAGPVVEPGVEHDELLGAAVYAHRGKEKGAAIRCAQLNASSGRASSSRSLLR